MLPSSKNYLNDGGFSAQEAGWILIGCFLAGVTGIQVVSRFLHHYIPSHVVDCDHTHEEQDEGEGTNKHSDDGHSHSDRHTSRHNGHASEDTPLLSREDNDYKPRKALRSRSATLETTQRPHAPFVTAPATRRPSLQTRITNQVSTLVSGAKASCDSEGPCYGYSDPCGQECFKAVSRSPTRAFSKTASTRSSRHPTIRRSATNPPTEANQALLEERNEESDQFISDTRAHREPVDLTGRVSHSRGNRQRTSFSQGHPSSQSATGQENGDLEGGSRRSDDSSEGGVPPSDPSQAHHHHVPTNAFLSIGLQTSIAIALHKLPEGFITFATNHANPELGFAVFVALFIHNLTEGFAMALPLYLALGSRWQAMFWSSLLGGVSQPLGAGIAAVWFKAAGRGDMAPGDRIYGGMFAVTAGIMTSVALQLFSESLGLTHNRNLCIAFAFIGMGILGISFALTA
ncbi:hypothetical protein MMC06_000011 [Schaereria dolodes]|nr:hypothetical protein [Schaereria dolodes]